MVAMLAFGGTFAYFTATATTRSGEVTTGYIKLSSGTDLVVAAEDVLPGDKILTHGVTLTPAYTGDAGEYVIVKIAVAVKAKDGTSKTLADLGIDSLNLGTGWVSLGDDLYMYGTNATTPTAMTTATQILGEMTLPTSVADNWTQDETASDNKLMEATLTLTINARGLQAENNTTGDVDALKGLFA